MSKARYSIVRVDRSCPLSDINIGNINIGNINVCKISKSCQNCLFGDTKEQLIKKVAQVLFKEKIKNFIKLFGKRSFLDKRWKQIYSKEATREAKKIVEFLGVKE